MVTLKLGSSLKALLGHVPYLPPRTREHSAYEYFAAPRLTEASCRKRPSSKPPGAA